jgi:hypothetical protein
MSMPEITLDGGCLCGMVRYRCTAEPHARLYCHCRMCQRAGGTPVVAWVTVPATALQWTGASPRVYRSSPDACRYFCAECGSPLAFAADAERDWIDITTASFDDPGSLAPAYHVWVSSRLPWFDTNDQLPRHKEGSA